MSEEKHLFGDTTFTACGNNNYGETATNCKKCVTCEACKNTEDFKRYVGFVGKGGCRK